MKSLRSLWGRFLFLDRGILPSKRLMMTMFLLSVVMIGLTFLNVSWIFIFIANGIILLVSLLDLFSSPNRKDLTIKRTIQQDIERGLVYKTKLNIQNNSNKSYNIKLIDGLPQSFEAPFPIYGKGDKQSNTTLSYEMMAPVRGKYDINKVYARYKSLLGLWEKQMLFATEDVVKVIPDLTETKQYLANAQHFLLHEGEKIRKQRSAEGEFSQIRDYVVGDDPRKINWRQTAKLHEVMTNEYEPEHGKHITLLIDCGRMMGAELTEGNRLEKSLEAALTVAAASLQSGDYVAVIAFAKDINTYVPPGKGLEHLQVILKSIYDLEVEASEPNYPTVFNYLQTVQKKRSLILLFSDVQTFLHDETTTLYLKRLRRRHMFLMVGIEDEDLIESTKIKPARVKEAMIKSIAQQQVQQKKFHKINMEKQGLLIIEAKEERLATSAVSKYIQIMNEGLL